MAKKDVLGHVRSGQLPEKSVYLYHLADEIIALLGGGVAAGASLVATVTCPDTTNILDVCHFVGLSSVEPTTNNTQRAVSLGIVIAKQTETLAELLLYGVCPVAVSGVALHDTVFLGVTGGITVSPPSSGYVQQLGVGIDTGRILFAPSISRVLRG